MSDQNPLPIPTNEPRRRRIRPLPLFPWFKDEKAFGGTHGPSSASSIRILILAVVACLGVIAWVAVESNDASHQAIKASQDVHDEITSGHKSRLKDEAALRRELAVVKSQSRDLACFVLAYFEHQPQSKRLPSQFLKNLGKRYDCAHYKLTAPVFPGSSTTPHSLPQPGASPSSTTHTVVAGPHGPTFVLPGPAPTSTTGRTTTPRPSSAPRPRPSSSSARPRPSPSPTSSTPRPLTSVVCSLTNRLLGLCLPL